MDKVLSAIAGVAILGAIFAPSRYANSYDVPESKVKRGVPIELILKNKHHVLIHKNRVATSGRSLDLQIIENDNVVRNNRGKVYKQFYDKKSSKYLILSLKK